MHDGNRRGDKSGWEKSGWGRNDWGKWGKQYGKGTAGRSDYGRYSDYGSGWGNQRSDYDRYPEAGGGAPPSEDGPPPAPAASVDDTPSPPSLWEVDNVRRAAETFRSRYRDFSETEIAFTAKSMMKQVSIRFTEAQL